MCVCLVSGQQGVRPTSLPYNHGLLTPHSHMEYTMGRPVELSAVRMSSYRALTLFCAAMAQASAWACNKICHAHAKSPQAAYLFWRRGKAVVVLPHARSAVSDTRVNSQHGSQCENIWMMWGQLRAPPLSSRAVYQGSLNSHEPDDRS